MQEDKEEQEEQRIQEKLIKQSLDDDKEEQEKLIKQSLDDDKEEQKKGGKTKKPVKQVAKRKYVKN